MRRDIRGNVIRAFVMKNEKEKKIYIIYWIFFISMRFCTIHFCQLIIEEIMLLCFRNWKTIDCSLQNRHKSTISIFRLLNFKFHIWSCVRQTKQNELFNFFSEIFLARFVQSSSPFWVMWNFTIFFVIKHIIYIIIAHYITLSYTNKLKSEFFRELVIWSLKILSVPEVLNERANDWINTDENNNKWIQSH